MAGVIVFEIDANVVRPGWTPLIITVLLAFALVFLYRSMRRQFGRIRHLPTEAEVAAAARQAAGRTDGAGAAASSPISPVDGVGHDASGTPRQRDVGTDRS